MAQRKSNLKLIMTKDEEAQLKAKIENIEKEKQRIAELKKAVLKKKKKEPLIKNIDARLILDMKDDEPCDRCYDDSSEKHDGSSDEDEYIYPTSDHYRYTGPEISYNAKEVYECYYCGSEDCTSDECHNFPSD